MKKNIFLLGLKLLITFGLIYYFLSKSDTHLLGTQLMSFSHISLVFSLFILIFILILVAIRWWIIADILRIPLTFKSACNLVFIGQFFNQFLPSSVGGDGIKIWAMTKKNIALFDATSSVICDRSIGLFALIFIALISAYFFSKPIYLLNFFDAKWFAVTLIATLSSLFFCGKKIANFMLKYRSTSSLGILLENLRTVLFNKNKSLVLISVSLITQMLTIFIVYIIACGMGVGLDLISCFKYVPIILIAAAIPISIAGWGLRESAMISGLNFAGIISADALAISILFGIIQIIASIPGLFLWLFFDNKKN
jgi:uncharacterized protein (TIRG00374 family)